MGKFTNKIFLSIYTLIGFIIVLGFLSLFSLVSIVQDIPDYKELLEYRPQGISRVYDGDGHILDEYANEMRVYVEYHDIPKVIIDAFIAAEDKNFFAHPGIDITSIIRSSIQNIANVVQNKRLVGGSTITQQVIKGFFLNNERSFTRKLKEAILAFRVNKIFSKEKILEIYLNQLYLGNHSYGIYIAAQNYFGKKLSDINIEEAALLAALPKAPSTLNPYKNYDRVLLRRNWVIHRMEEEDFISHEERLKAITTPIELSYFHKSNNEYRDYYTTAVKAELIEMFSFEELYKQAYVINTNINLQLQKVAQQVLRDGLRKFDKKGGWRGAFAKINLEHDDITESLKKIAHEKYHYKYRLGVITKVNKMTLVVTMENQESIQLEQDSYQWIVNGNMMPSQLKKLFKLGDVILIDEYKPKKYKIEQIPEINGGIIVIENRTGKILSLVGGFDVEQSSFNRVTQAYRQPGSAFKTFIYLAAFEQGIAPNTQVLDEPLEINLGRGLPTWNPRNYDDKYYGLTTVRMSFEKSSNLAALRLMLGIGLDNLVEIAQRYLIYEEDLKPTYAIALGAAETTLLKLANAYSSIANNGILKQPKLIDSVYNRWGKLIYAPKDLFCNNCEISPSDSEDDKNKLQDEHQYNAKKTEHDLQNTSLPEIGFLGKSVTNSVSNYQILSLLEGVVDRGSARRARWTLSRVLAGKTGTTNDSLDTWFIGMTSDITVGVFVGYVIPRDMGKNATGSNVALPIFIDFFNKSEFIPNTPFKIPDSIQKMYVDLDTGALVDKGEFVKGRQYIQENFKK
jgi:penicillin-binding protein 1A